MIVKYETTEYRNQSATSHRWFTKLREKFGVYNETSNASFVGDAKNQARMLRAAKAKLLEAGYDAEFNYNYEPALVGFDSGPGWELWTIKLHSQREMHDDMGIILIDFEDDIEAVYFKLIMT
jgi:hypothetical protein